MSTGGFRFEVDPQRDVAGNGPVVSYEVQEDRGLDQDGMRAWYVWSATDGLLDAQESYRTVASFKIKRPIRLAKITTEVMEVPE